MLARRALASFLALAVVVARDAPELAPASSVGVGAALAVLMIVTIGLHELAGRVDSWRFPGRVSQAASAAIVIGIPLVMGIARFWSPRGAHPTWAWVAILAPAVVLGYAIRRTGDRLGGVSGPGRVLVTAVVMAGFVALHVVLATLVAIRPGTLWLHLGSWVSTWLSSWALAALLSTPAVTRGRVGTVESIVRIAIGLALLEADRRFLRGLYGPMHLWLGVAGILVLETGIRAAVSRISDRVALRAGAVAGVFLVALGAFAATHPGRFRDPEVRAEIASTSSGAWVVVAVPAAARGRSVATAAARRALRIARYLDEPSPCPGCNILLVTVDALRADQIGSPDHPNENAPRLAAFALSAVRFRHAYSQGTGTTVALSALMVGRWGGSIDWELWAYSGKTLHDPRATSVLAESQRVLWTALPHIATQDLLAERLRRVGYWTMAAPFVRDNDMRVGFGFDRGFDRYEDMSTRGWRGNTASKVIDVADRQRAAAPVGRPWFQWIHLYDPHESGSVWSTYHRRVASVDAAFGRLLGEIDRDPALAARTVVVLLADHGEAFGEHGEVRHGTTPYEEQARVPLLVRIPGIPPRDEQRPVAAIDATATMLGIAGAETRAIEGVNLVALLTRGAYPDPRPIFVENLRYLSTDGKPTRDVKALVLGDRKLIVDRHRGTVMLFDLARDPGERQNLLARERRLYARLRGILDAFVTESEHSHPLP